MTVRRHRDPILTYYGTLSDKLTTGNGYADVGIWDVVFFRTKHLYFVATGNNLVAQVLASMDGGATYDIIVEADIAVNVGTAVSKSYTTYWTDLKVQVKPAVAGAHGTLATKIAGASF